jgi:hypothetical protein
MIAPRFACSLGTLLALVATTIAAQTDTPGWNTVKALAPGTQVRITAGSRMVRGQIDRITDDALLMISERGQETFDRQQVSAVLVKRLNHRKRNALIGLAAGAGVGLGIGIAARSSPGQLQIIPNAAITAGFAVAGALGGTIAGAVIPTGGWREVYKK